jgi:hypothetical protein
MTNDPRSDSQIRSWIEAGPDAASAEFVERTLRPIPRMRQRRSWRITLGRLLEPLPLMATVASVFAVVATGMALGGLVPRSEGPGGQASPSAPDVSLRPTFELSMGEGPSARVYRSDPSASVATCDMKPDGATYALYAGGEPFVSIDLIVGSGAAGPGGASRVAAEITAGDTYVRFDPAILRGGDRAGRSQATVDVITDGPATTFVVVATTPDRTSGEDGDPIQISLMLTCQP